MGEIRDTSHMGQTQHTSVEPATLGNTIYEYNTFAFRGG